MVSRDAAEFAAESKSDSNAAWSSRRTLAGSEPEETGKELALERLRG